MYLISDLSCGISDLSCGISYGISDLSCGISDLSVMLDSEDWPGIMHVGFRGVPRGFRGSGGTEMNKCQEVKYSELSTAFEPD